MKQLIIIALVCLIISCRRNSTDPNVPQCINDKIEFLKSQPPGNPSYSVYRYTYRGEKVYFFPEQCCDQYSDLYDDRCNLICNPSMGLLGTDPRCSDFHSARTNEELIWKDNR